MRLCESQGRLDWRSRNEHYPFYRGVFYDKVTYSGKNNFCVKRFRKKLKRGKDIPYHETSYVHHHHMFPFGFFGVRRRSGFKYVYYHRCKECFATRVDNIPFDNMICEITKMFGVWVPVR